MTTGRPRNLRATEGSQTMTRLQPRHLLRAEHGYALVLSLVILLALTVLGLTLLTLGTTEVASSANWKDYSKAFYAADGGLESGVVGLRALLVSTPAPTGTQLATITAPTLTSPGLSFSAYSVTQLSPAPYQIQIATGPYAGMKGIATDYQIAAQVAAAGGTQSSLTQVFQYIQVPLFQFAVFYGKGVDLEIAPGANMTLNGPIFANSNIYMAPGATLQVNSRMATAGNIYRTIKSSGVEGLNGNPQIMDDKGSYKALNFDHVDKKNFTGSWTASQWQAEAQSTFGGMVKDSAMGITEITPPVPSLFNNPCNPDTQAHTLIEMPQGGDSSALTAAKLYTQADLRIVNGVATDQNGNPVTLPAGTITTTSTFFDSREGQMMAVTQVDVSKLNTAVPVSGGGSCSSGCLTNWNGMVYVASTTNSFGPSTPCSSNKTLACPAVRLVNGANAGTTTLPTKGLTVVSQNPVYIQGDYNPGLPATQAPAAVLADAVTVLSNNWSDANAATSSSTLGSRTPTATSVNAAIATGPSNESTSGAGNGQLENDIRFLENWSGVTINYSGSLVNLWHSQQVTQPWQNTGVYYNAPVRNWSYDTLFDTTIPPGTPKGVVMQKGRWARS